MPADGSLEEQVRQRYRQPKGVEQFGIEPIPDRLKTVRWHDLFLIVANFLINPGAIPISGLAVASGLSFTEAVASQACGVIVAMATIGVDCGVPGRSNPARPCMGRLMALMRLVWPSAGLAGGPGRAQRGLHGGGVALQA